MSPSNISDKVLEELADFSCECVDDAEVGLAINLLATAEQLRRARAAIAECATNAARLNATLDHWYKRACELGHHEGGSQSS